MSIVCDTLHSSPFTHTFQASNIHIHIHIHIYIYIYIYIHIHININIYVHIRIYIHIHIHIHTHTHKHTHTHIHIHTSAYTHTQSHTRTHARPHARQHARPPARTHARNHVRTQPRTQARTQARTHAHASQADMKHSHVINSVLEAVFGLIKIAGDLEHNGRHSRNLTLRFQMVISDVPRHVVNRSDRCIEPCLMHNGSVPVKPCQLLNTLLHSYLSYSVFPRVTKSRYAFPNGDF
jgi:hypothetical protein